MPRNLLLARPVPGLWSLCILLRGYKHWWPRKAWHLPVWCNFGKEGGFSRLTKHPQPSTRIPRRSRRVKRRSPEAKGCALAPAPLSGPN